MLLTYFGKSDHVGHDISFDTPEYHEVFKLLDVYVGQNIHALKDAGIYDETIFIVTSDHKGVGKGYGKGTIQEMGTPFILCGKSIKNNHEIEEYRMRMITLRYYRL